LIASEITVEAEKIWGMVRELNLRSEVFRETGGTHSAMLGSLDGGVLSFSEDVGRHNAVDKVIGAGILMGVELGECVLVSSGRQSSELVLKVAHSGIPVIASVAGPLKSGIGIADAAGITLVCFVRGRRMNIYTHHERISIKRD
jgi:FdhD protein